MSGADVLAGRARVLESGGRDVTAAYIDGAKAALDLARQTGCVAALLIDGSPSCGSRAIYDGTFSGVKHAGEGVTAALFAAAGLPVFSHEEVEALEAFLADLSPEPVRHSTSVISFSAQETPSSDPSGHLLPVGRRGSLPQRPRFSSPHRGEVRRAERRRGEGAARQAERHDARL